MKCVISRIKEWNVWFLGNDFVTFACLLKILQTKGFSLGRIEKKQLTDSLKRWKQIVKSDIIVSVIIIIHGINNFLWS